MEKVIVIIGPTGVGKTKLSIELAKKYHGEIINADAMQVYKNLDIGTAKIKEEEKEEIPHHLFDIKNVWEEYSIYHYQKDCRSKIREVCSRGKIPILVGGTGLYVKSALYDYKLEENQNDKSCYDKFNTEELYQKLIQLDEKAIDKIDCNNRRRVINALDFYQKNGFSITENKTDELLYEAIFIGLTTNREKLYQMINHRVDDMISDGLLNEVRYFYEKKIFTKPLLGGIGYKELYSYLDGNISFDNAVELIKRNSRRYAKRQYTFFHHQMNVKWFDTDYDNFENTIREVSEYIDNKFCL